MNPRKTPALVDPPKPELKPGLAADGGVQGPMSEQINDGCGINELHPQQLPQLVGFRDPDAHKHEGDASVDALDAAVPAAAA
jgi:hypothetical protein